MRRRATILALGLTLMAVPAAAAVPPQGGASVLHAPGARPPAHVLEEPTVELALAGGEGTRFERIRVTATISRGPDPFSPRRYLPHGAFILSALALVAAGRRRRERAYDWMLRR